MELSPKRLLAYKEMIKNQKKKQYALMKEKPSDELLGKLEVIYSNTWLFYKVFLFYENLKKSLKT